MSLFIKGRVAVTESGVVAESAITSDMDVVFIHPKMPYGVKQAVIGAAMRVDVKPARVGRGKKAQPAPEAASTPDVTYDVGAYNTALLVGNVIGWQGPSFAEAGAFYSNETKAELLKMIDESAPLWQAVLTEIGRRNTEVAESDEVDAGPKLALIRLGDNDSEE